MASIPTADTHNRLATRDLVWTGLPNQALICVALTALVCVGCPHATSLVEMLGPLLILRLPSAIRRVLLSDFLLNLQALQSISRPWKSTYNYQHIYTETYDSLREGVLDALRTRLAALGRRSLWKLQLSPVRDLANPTYEELVALDVEDILPGKQCAHAVRDWFRGTVRPRKSPEAVFREIMLTAHMKQADKDRLIANYLPGKHTRRGQRSVADDEANKGPGFPKFRQLPSELQSMIWRRTVHVPSRLVDVRQVTGWLPPSPKYVSPMGVPSIAQVARDLRYEVQRHGQRTVSACVSGKADPSQQPQPQLQPQLQMPSQQEGDDDETPFIPIVPLSPIVTKTTDPGFLLPGDVMYYGALSNRESPLQSRDSPPQPLNRHECHPRDLARLCGSTAVACWWRPEVFTWDWGDADHPPSLMGTRAEVMPFLDTWSFLSDIPTLRTVWVSWIGGSPRCATYARCDRDGVAIRCRTREGDEDATITPEGGPGVVRVNVDLFDDARIAEILSLDSLDWQRGDTDDYGDGGTGGGKPFLAVHSRRGRHCLHCERTRYHETYKPLLSKLWVLLCAQGQLSLEDRAHVLDGEGRPNRENVWVQRTLDRMPNFKPYVSFQLFPQTDEDPEGDCLDYSPGERTVHDYTHIKYRSCSKEVRLLYSEHFQTPHYI